VHVAFDGEPAWQLFDGDFQRDWKDSVPIEPDALITSGARATPLPLDEVRMPPSPWWTNRPGQCQRFAADALRQAASSGAELKDLALPKNKAGRTVVNAVSVLRALRSHQADVELLQGAA
jgi:hypothetical protein